MTYYNILFSGRCRAMSVHLFSTELAQGGSSGIGAFYFIYDLCHVDPAQGHHPIVYLILAFQLASERLTHHDSAIDRGETQKP